MLLVLYKYLKTCWIFYIDAPVRLVKRVDILLLLFASTLNQNQELSGTFSLIYSSGRFSPYIYGIGGILILLAAFYIIRCGLRCIVLTGYPCRAESGQTYTSWSKGWNQMSQQWFFGKVCSEKRRCTDAFYTYMCCVQSLPTLASASCAQKLSFNPRFNGYPLNLSRRSITIDFLWIWFFFDQLKHRTFCGLLNLAPVGKEFHHTSVSIFAGASYA